MKNYFFLLFLFCSSYLFSQPECAELDEIVVCAGVQTDEDLLNLTSDIISLDLDQNNPDVITLLDHNTITFIPSFIFDIFPYLAYNTFDHPDVDCQIFYTVLGRNSSLTTGDGGIDFQITSCPGTVDIANLLQFDCVSCEYNWTLNGSPHPVVFTNFINTSNQSSIQFSDITTVITTPGVHELCIEVSKSGVNCTDLYCFDIVIEELTDEPTFEAIGYDDCICPGQDIYFQNDQIYEAANGSYTWEVIDDATGNIVFSTESIDLLYLFNNPGNYTVQLTYSQMINQTECVSPTSTFPVEVKSLDFIEISCPSVVCSGGPQVSYIALGDESCSNYQWTYTGPATNVDQNTDGTIKITWGEVTEYTVASVVLESADCDEDYCFPNIIDVPLFPTSATIIGPEQVCNNQFLTYVAPDIPGSFYDWSIEVENINGDISTHTANSNSSTQNVFFPLLPHGIVTISVTISNPYAGCEVTGEIDVLYPDITGDDEICLGDNFSLDYQLPNNPTVNYTITDFTGKELESGTALPINYTPDEAGIYYVDFKTDGATCFEPVEITVYNVMTPMITGEFDICPGETYSYSIPCGSDESALWTVIGGTIVSDFGCFIEVVWDENAPEYQIEVVKMLELNDGTFCSGQTEIEVVEVAMPQLEISGPSTVCYDALSSYTINDIGAEEYIWTIDPENLGSIVDGQGTTDVNIQWLYNPNVTSAVIHVEGNICGSPVPAMMTVNFGDLSLDISAPSTVCEGESQVVSITGVEESLESWASIEWLINGSPHTLGNDMDQVTFVFDEIGTYAIQAIVTNPNGCFQVVNLNTQIDVVETPEPQFSYAIDCPLTANNYTINVANINGSATYEWYIDNVLVPGETNSSISITQADLLSPLFILKVKVTLANGCFAFEEFDFGSFCLDPGGDCCTPELSIDNFFLDGCQTVAFNGSTPFFQDYTNMQWIIFYEFNTPQQMIETPIDIGTDILALNQSGISLSFGPGEYLLTLQAQCGVDSEGNPCIGAATQTIILPFEEDFTYFFSCDPGNTTYTLHLIDNSEYSDDSPAFTNQITYEWTATGQSPQSGMGLQEVEFTGLTPGFPIDVSLNLVRGAYGDDECSPLVKTINVPNLPDADFSIMNDYSCLGQVLTFSSTQDPSELFLTDWDFGDGSLSRINPVEKVYSDETHPNHPNYDVTLSVTDIYGCTASNTETLTITDNSINGNITYTMMGSCDAMAELTFNEDSGNAFPLVSYEWSHPNAGNDKNASITQSGVYSLTVTDSQGCTEVFTTSEIVLDDAFISDLFATNSTCGHKDIFFNIETGYEFLIQVFDGTTTYFTSETRFDDAGNYTVTVYVFDFGPVDENTNLATACAYDEVSFEIILEPDAPNLGLGEFNCNTNAIPVQITNSDDFNLEDHTINWSGPGVVNATDVFSINAFSNDQYTATVIDRETGCFSETTIDLTNAAPDLSGMITGCYETCQEGGLLDDGILVSPVDGENGSWSWNLDDTPIPGYSGINTNPRDLVLGDLTFVLDQEYKITFTYTIDGCEFESEPFCLTVVDCTQAPCIVFADGEACGNDPIDCAVSENDGGPIFFINMEYLIPTGDNFDPPVPGVTLSYCDVEPVLVDNGTLFVSDIEQIGNDQLNMIGSFEVDDPSIWSGANPLAVEVSYCGSDGNIYCVQYQINPVNCPPNPLECNVWFVGATSAGPKSRDVYLAQYCVNLYNVNSNGCQSTNWTIEGEFEDINGNITPAYFETVDITGQGTVVTHCFDVEIPADMDLNQVPFLGFTITSNCPGIGCYHNFHHLGHLNNSGNPLPLVGHPFDESENEFTIDIPSNSYDGFVEGTLHFEGRTYIIDGIHSEHDIIVEHTWNGKTIAYIATIQYTDDKGEGHIEFVEISFGKRNDSKLNDIKIYPNPFTDKFRVEYEMTDSSSMKILDILGRTIEYSTRTVYDNLLEISFDAIEGVYFIQIYEGDQLIRSEKIFKLR